jgi:hypothetical protein
MTKFCIFLHIHPEHQATVGLSIALYHEPPVRLISNISSRLFCLLYTPKTATYVRGSPPIGSTLILNAALGIVITTHLVMKYLPVWDHTIKGHGSMDIE